MKKIFLAAAILLCPLFGHAQVTPGWHRVAQVVARGSSGTQAVVVPNANIYVTGTGSGTVATIYSDPLLSIPIPTGMVTSDSSGNYSYYMPLGYCVNERASYPGSGNFTTYNICTLSGGGVTRIIAGTNISLSPTGGTGAVTVNASGCSVNSPNDCVITDPTVSQTITQPNSTAFIFQDPQTNGVTFTGNATAPEVFTQLSHSGSFGSLADWMQIDANYGGFDITTNPSDSTYAQYQHVYNFDNSGLDIYTGSVALQTDTGGDIELQAGGGETGVAANSASIELLGNITFPESSLSANTTLNWLQGGAGPSYGGIPSFQLNATSGSFTVTLAAASGPSTNLPTTLWFFKNDSTSNAITIAAKSGDTINGASSISLSTPYQVLQLMSDGVSKWYVGGLVAANTCITGSGCTLANGTTATTQTVGDNTTKVATDAFVIANASGSSGVQYNPTTTSYIVSSFSGLYDDSDSNSISLGVPSNVTCVHTTTSTCTVAFASPHGLSVGGAVDMFNLASWPYGQQAAQFGSFQVTTVPDSTHITFTTPTVLTYTCSSCTGNVYDASYWGIWDFAREPFIYGHGTVYGIETSTQSLAGNFTSLTSALVGTPTYLIDQTGQNDLAAGRTVSQIETDHQTVWTAAHNSGMIVMQTTMVPANYGVSTENEKPGQINLWYWAQTKTQALVANGKYFDLYADTATALNFSYGVTFMPGQQANVFFADALNAAFSTQRSVKVGPPIDFSYSQTPIGGTGIQSRYIGSRLLWFDNGFNQIADIHPGTATGFSVQMPLTIQTTGAACLGTNGSGTIGAGTCGTGTVASVGLTFPGTLFSSVTNSPVTTSGTLTPVATTPAANTVLAGPTSGGSGAYGFRSLVTADIPASVALLASPTFTGVPAAPTATGGTSTTQLATTAFVQAAIAAAGTGAGIVTYSGPSLTFSGTQYFPIGGGATASTTETNVDIDSPAAVTIQNMTVQMSAAPGIGNSVVYTWRKNASSTVLTCTISGASATSCSDTTHNFTTVSLDLLDIQAVTTGTVVGTPTVVMAAQVGVGTVGSVSSFSGDGALLSNSLSTGPVTATLANAGAHKFWGNNTGSSTAPGYESITAADLTGIRQWSCQPGIGDGLNAITAGTYLQSTCKNTTGVTVTLTGLSCFTDNSGTSTMNAAGNTLGALLTGAVTCTSSFAAGTQSANVALTNGDYIKFTFVADGTSKQSTWVVTGTY